MRNIASYSTGTVFWGSPRGSSHWVAAATTIASRIGGRVLLYLMSPGVCPTIHSRGSAGARLPVGCVCLDSPPAVGVQVWCDNAGHICPNRRALSTGPSVRRCCQLSVCFGNSSAQFTGSPAGGGVSGVWTAENSSAKVPLSFCAEEFFGRGLKASLGRNSR